MGGTARRCSRQRRGRRWGASPARRRGPGRRRVTLAVGGLLLAAALYPGTASAGGPTDPIGGERQLGKRGGLKYISERLEVGTGGTHSPPYEATQIACGGHAGPWHPTGGGAKLSGGAAQNWFATMRPRDLDEPFESPPDVIADDWWDTVTHSVVGRTMTGYAICSKRSMDYHALTVPSSASPGRTASVSCEPGSRLAGGGAFIATSDSFINSSYPSGAGTWRTRIYDTVGGLGGMVVYAVCRNRRGVAIKSARKRLRPGRAGSATARCPRARHVSGGGGALSGPIADAHLAGTTPVDGGDRDRVPDDGWRVTAHNDAGGAKTLRAFAICVRRG
jgi:hypothetical protein